ncbi:MAG TPA: glycosyltransferase [Candidatus Acidoferrum sp.]|jgi:glycosyltransferase involved in cell wall biosynthesis
MSVAELQIDGRSIARARGRDGSARGVYLGSEVEAHPGIWVRGYVYGASGYAQEMLPLVLGLESSGRRVRVDPVGSSADYDGLMPHRIRTALEVMKLRPMDLAKSVLFQLVPGADFRLDLYARSQVGRTMFETDSLPDGWAEQCNAMDEVWVPSQFNYETFAAAGVEEKRLRRTLEGEDTHLFRPGHAPLEIPETRGFNFLSIFEWIMRKGPDVLLRAFLTEFRGDEDVALIIRAYGRPDRNAELLPQVLYFIERELKMRLEDCPPVILVHGFLDNLDMPRLYAGADCFVLPSRGEGWGRPYTEALACEVPVIATRWSGQMDFLTDANSYLVDCKVVPVPANVDTEVYAGHRWAEPDVEHLRALMRRAFTKRDEAKQKAMRGRCDVVEKLDWSVITEAWGKEFERLLA